MSAKVVYARDFPDVAGTPALFVAFAAPHLSVSDQVGWRPVGRLEHNGKLYRFQYLRGARKAGFQPFTGMTNLNWIYESDELFPLFANRLLSKSRTEYAACLRWSGLDRGNPPDPLTLLGITEGIRWTDAVEVFPVPIPDTRGGYRNNFFLHGLHLLPMKAMARISQLAPAEPLKLRLDFWNGHDPNAVAVSTAKDHSPIGFLPRYLAYDIWRFVNRHGVNQYNLHFIELQVVQVNHDAPLQNRVLCQMNVCWPDSFRPCSGEDFAPISTNTRYS